MTIADYVADLRAPTPSAAAELAVFDYRQFEAARLSYQAALGQAMARKTELFRYRAEQYRLKLLLHDPERTLREQRQRLADIQDALGHAMEQKITGSRHRLALLGSRLHGLSPLERISGGFGFVTDERGKRLESVRQTAPGEAITLRISDGTVRARVLETEEHEIPETCPPET